MILNPQCVDINFAVFFPFLEITKPGKDSIDETWPESITNKQ